jgi:hypothetical protein
MVAVTSGGGIVRVEAGDRSGPGVPESRSAGGDAEGGRGSDLWRAWPRSGAGGGVGGR